MNSPLGVCIFRDNYSHAEQLCAYYYSLLILKLLNQESFNKSYDYIMLEAISFSGENRAQVEGTGAG